MKNLSLERPLVFFDLETTGIHIGTDRIIEIAMLKIHPNGKEEWRVQRINPEIPINPEATMVHGISDEDVKDEPTFAEYAPTVALFMHDCDLAGYNSNRFDIPMLVDEFLRVDIHFSLEGRKCIDAFKIFTHMEKRNLTAAYKFYCNKDLENAHEAQADVIATQEVLDAQLERYQDTLKTDLDHLHALSKDDDFVDLGRRMVYKDGVELFNFGKYKGRPVRDVVQREPQYLDWILRGEFPRHTKYMIRELKRKYAK